MTIFFFFYLQCGNFISVQVAGVIGRLGQDLNLLLLLLFKMWKRQHFFVSKS